MKKRILLGLLAAGLLAFPGTASAAGDGLFLPVAETDAPLPLVLPFVLDLGVNECLSFVRDFAAEQTEKAGVEKVAESLAPPEERNFYAMPGDDITADSEEIINDLSAYIIKGHVLGSQNVVLSYDNYTLTDFEVTTVYKGNGISPGDIVQIKEPYHTETYTDGWVTIYRRNNYTESIVGESYVFYLNQDKDGTYWPSYTSLSRYPLNDEITVTFPGSYNPNYTEENYNKLRKAVLEKYH